jgi:serine/threonine protein phosphatase 1
MRKICFSDIHGHPKTFEASLDHWAFTKADQLFLLGDYVDRGPDSKAVIDRIWALQNDGYFVHCLAGNHEHMVLADREQETRYPYLSAGDKPFLASFEVYFTREIPEKYFEWMRKLPVFHEVEGFILVHAGLNFLETDPFSDEHSMLWSREWYGSIRRDWLDGRIIVHGHTPVKKMVVEWQLGQIRKNDGCVLNIDNGCFFTKIAGTGELCSFDLTNRKLHFEPNRDL